MTLRDLLGHPVIICCGSGGVGKTSVSAALALKAALDGRKAVVATIDPARRLATAMGIESLRNEPRRIAFEGVDLSAMMLDSKRTFDALILKYASPEVAQQILSNRYYQAISSRIAGTENYMAMEKLYELHGLGEFETIVLDTPPTRHALDFLDAPDRMQNMLQESILKWLIRPYFAAGRISLNFLRRGTDRVVEFIDHIFGLQFVHDLSDFFRAFTSLYDGFRERSGRVMELLRSRDVAFVAVAAPTAASLSEATIFQTTLESRAMNFAGFILNRVHTMPAMAEEDRRRIVESTTEDPEHPTAALFRNYLNFQDIATREWRLIEAAIDRRLTLTALPILEEDIHDMHSLRRMAEAFDSGRVARRRRHSRAAGR